jgi:4-diphosphocytidyl-2-C-methyl-D-erythritol kinase
MILFPPAKINLGLRVLHKRSDGYHEIDSCMIAIPMYDVLELLPAEEFSFKQTGLTIDGDPEANLCVKAYRLMEKHFNVPPTMIHLRKEIPMGAGLGGGSADAAYVLRGLSELYSFECSDEFLCELAAQLGSDCPFFIIDQAQVAGGRGEVLKGIDLTLKGYFLKVVNPGIHVGTREAYAGIQFPRQPEKVEDVLALPIEEWKDSLINDFESSIFALHPELAEIKARLYAEGAVYAAMSGSGSTLFGIYRSCPKKSFQDRKEYLEKVLTL